MKSIPGLKRYYIFLGGAVATILIAVMLTSSPAFAAESVTIGTQTSPVNGCNIYRSTDFLVVYTRVGSQIKAPTNEWGFEAAVSNGVITEIQSLVGGMNIPQGGAVLSGHGVSRKWLQSNAAVGKSVILPGCAGINPTPTPTSPPPSSPPPNSPELLPDLGIRNATNVSLDTTTTPGIRKLRFKTVTANKGAGPFLMEGKRSSVSDPTLTTQQRVYRADGTSYLRPSEAIFYFAGDGHNHWHVRDIDRFELVSKSSGGEIRTGEKHGFCFEDNTGYRGWPGSPNHPASPANPYYVPPAACGLNQPNSLNVIEGLSVGWGDTYPPTLPDQYINVTGLPNGVYRLTQTADWANWFLESDENNNSAWEDISITATTATVIGSGGGI